MRSSAELNSLQKSFTYKTRGNTKSHISKYLKQEYLGNDPYNRNNSTNKSITMLPNKKSKTLCPRVK